MNASARDMVARLWGLCHILRDDGITYHQYVSELSSLLFLEMAEEVGVEHLLPVGSRWRDLRSCADGDRLPRYRAMLARLASADDLRVRQIFHRASTSLRRSENLDALVRAIDELDWYSVRAERLGDMYEGLLQKNAAETKSGAGQYFTPRPLIECMVSLVRPRPGEVIQDPALGTGGFLTAAGRYIARSAPAGERVVAPRLVGVELVPEVHRLAVMNLMLHRVEGEVLLGDALSEIGSGLAPADVILTNPPFGTKRGGAPSARSDLTLATANKQLAFLEHIYRGLRPGGRAAVVVPDSVLRSGGVGRKMRVELMHRCDLHTILRLPTGIFYAKGIKTNVLFFTRGHADRDQTERVWIYDMRTGMPTFGKRTPLTREHFADFETCHGGDEYGRGPRTDQGRDGRLRCLSRADIARRGDDLDVTWAATSAETMASPPSAEAIADEILDLLRAATDEISALRQVLVGSRPTTGAIPPTPGDPS